MKAVKGAGEGAGQGAGGGAGEKQADQASKLARLAHEFAASPSSFWPTHTLYRLPPNGDDAHMSYADDVVGDNFAELESYCARYHGRGTYRLVVRDVDGGIYTRVTIRVDVDRRDAARASAAAQAAPGAPIGTAAAIPVAAQSVTAQALEIVQAFASLQKAMAPAAPAVIPAASGESSASMLKAGLELGQALANAGKKKKKEGVGEILVEMVKENLPAIAEQGKGALDILRTVVGEAVKDNEIRRRREAEALKQQQASAPAASPEEPQQQGAATSTAAPPDDGNPSGEAPVVEAEIEEEPTL